MARTKSEATIKMEEMAAKRPACFTGCNIHAIDPDTKQKVCYTSEQDKCPAFDDCIVVAPLMNKGYDPKKPEEAGKNATTFAYSNLDIPSRVKVEKKLLDAQKPAEPEKPVRSRPEEPATVRSRPVQPESPAKPEPEVKQAEPDELDSILGGIDDLTESGEKASELTEGTGETIEKDDALGDLLTEADPAKPAKEEVPTVSEEQVEPAAEASVEVAVEKAKEEKKVDPKFENLDVRFFEHLIDYFIQKAMQAYIDMNSYSNSKPAPRVKVATVKTPAEKPVKKRGPKVKTTKTTKTKKTTNGKVGAPRGRRKKKG